MGSDHEYQKVRCACVVANIEGRFHFQPSESLASQLPISLDDLSKRLRVLEVRKEIRGALPTDSATWNSLAWRLSRLDRMLLTDNLPMGAYSPPSRVVRKTLFGQLASPAKEGDGEDISLDMASEVIDDVAARWSHIHLPPLSKDADIDNDVLLGVLLQRLAYLAGRQQVRFDVFPANAIPTSPRELFVMAVEFSLETENTPRPVAPPPPQVEILNSRRNRKKACCGCCSCNCHSKPNSVGRFFPSPPRRHRHNRPGVGSKIKRFFSFRWVKSLACWRRGEVLSDSSSSSSGTLLG